VGRHPEGRHELLLDFPLDERKKRPAIPFHLAIDEHLLRPVPLPVADAKLEPSAQPSIQLDVSRQIRRRFEIVRRNAALENDGARGASSAPKLVSSRRCRRSKPSALRKT
jgi:hypothetical protein